MCSCRATAGDRWWPHPLAALFGDPVGSHVHLQCPPLLLVTILQTSRYLHPVPRMACISPGFASGYRRFPRRTYLAHLVPPGVGGLQSQHVTRAEFAKSPFETLVFTIERIGNHSPEGAASAHGHLHQL